MIYALELPNKILFSTRKMDVTYAHINFKRGQKVRFLELTEKQFSKVTKKTKRI